MSSGLVFQLYILNIGVSIALAIWIYRDSKARCMRSFRYQPLFIFLAGMAGLWFPYILYYMLFRTPGQLVRCPQDEHWMSEVLPKCPSCNPSMLMSPRQLEKHLESWKITKNINTLMDKLPTAHPDIKELETRLWFERLSHYQKSYLYYLTVNATILTLMAVFVSLMIFSPGLKLDVIPLMAVLILIFLFCFSSISVYQILRCIQVEIEMVKIILTTLVDERGEFFRSKSRDIFSSLSAWGMQVSSSLLATVTILVSFAHFEPYTGLFSELTDKQPFLLVFFKLLVTGLLLALYISLVMRIKEKMDYQQIQEIYNILEKLVTKKTSKETTVKTTKPSSKKARPARRKPASK